MTDARSRNLAASVRQRLLNLARATGRPFQEIIQYFAMERFLYRLAQSQHSEHFVLKGALMLTVWQAPESRPTRDIDLLGHMSNSVESVVRVIGDICRQAVEPDGLVFDSERLNGQEIKEDADYSGVRITFHALLGTARIPMQIDIGFGDVIHPAPTVAEYPTILDQLAPCLQTYPRETVVAEKYEAMVKLAQLNSRMKDFFDLWLLSRQFAFEASSLAAAVQATFENRGTPLGQNPVALTDEFADDRQKQSQWTAFLRRSRLEIAPAELPEVVQGIENFLGPIHRGIQSGSISEHHWPAGGPWITPDAEAVKTTSDSKAEKR